jgi:flavin-dependent dehydrogenase
LEALIAGGGVAGAAVACLLGPRAVLIEREAQAHDKICGEFISHEAQSYLARLGIDPLALGASRIDAVRLVHAGRVACAALRFQGLSLSRRALDKAMLARAEQSGAELLRGHAVRSASPAGLEVDGKGRLSAPAVFLATGKHDLRGARRQPGRVAEDLVGLKMYFALDPAQRAELTGHVEILLFHGGYAGLQLVEGGAANLCLLMKRALFKAAGGAWPGVRHYLEQACPHLARRLAGAAETLGRPLSIFRVPYGHVHAPGPADWPGLFRLGDQMGVIPSFCGDGISIALHSAFAAVAAHQGSDAQAYHARMRLDIKGQIDRAGWLYRAGRAQPGLAVAAAQAWPGALRWVARLTRVPPWAMADL